MSDGDVISDDEWEARRAQVKRDLDVAIAETLAEIARLEALLAEQRKAESEARE